MSYELARACWTRKEVCAASLVGPRLLKTHVQDTNKADRRVKHDTWKILLVANETTKRIMLAICKCRSLNSSCPMTTHSCQPNILELQHFDTLPVTALEALIHHLLVFGET